MVRSRGIVYCKDRKCTVNENLCIYYYNISSHPFFFVIEYMGGRMNDFVLDSSVNRHFHLKLSQNVSFL